MSKYSKNISPVTHDQSPLLIKKMEMGEVGNKLPLTPSVILEKRRIIEEEEFNANCLFSGLIRVLLIIIALLFATHYLLHSSDHNSTHNHKPVQGNGPPSTSSTTQTICGGVIIQHPQKFNCVWINNKFVIVNKITGKISDNGNDDKQDDDYNDNSNTDNTN
jgi:hypothetical protein